MRRLKIKQPDLVSDALRYEVQSAAHARFLHRLHCVQLVAQGCSCSQVAEWFLEHPRTIERWVKRYVRYGIEGLNNEHKCGRTCTLSDGQRGALRRDVQLHPANFGYVDTSWSGRLLGIHLEEKYGFSLSIRQCQRLLKQLHN